MAYLPERELRAPLITDFWLFSLSLLLVSFSLVMVYSTTGVVSQEKYGDPFFYVRRQGFAAALGFILMILISKIDIETIKKIAVVSLPIALILAALPLIPGIGDKAGGAHRWVNLGIRFQPSEFVKIFYVLFIAGYFSRHSEEIQGFVWGILKPLFFVSTVGALLLLQPDFGSTVILVGITILLGVAAGTKLRYILTGGMVCAISLGMLVIVSPYRMRRIFSFLNPLEDTAGKGYQLIQSLIAIGSGEVSGVGLGAGQQKLFFLPAAHTDFIFSVVGEELGLIGCVALLSVFLVLLWRGFWIAKRNVNNTFGFNLAVGLILLIVLPAMANVGVATGLLPTKGMVLPLVGYGGSSILSSLMVIGLLLGLSRQAMEKPR